MVEVARFPDGQQFFRLHTRELMRSTTSALFCAMVKLCKRASFPGARTTPFSSPLDIGEQDPLLGVYKPCRGEAPLWDFPARHTVPARIRLLCAQ